MKQKKIRHLHSDTCADALFFVSVSVFSLTIPYAYKYISQNMYSCKCQEYNFFTLQSEQYALYDVLLWKILYGGKYQRFSLPVLALLLLPP